MSRKIGNAQSRATFFRHSAVLSLPAVLLRKLAIVLLTTAKNWTKMKNAHAGRAKLLFLPTKYANLSLSRCRRRYRY